MALVTHYIKHPQKQALLLVDNTFFQFNVSLMFFCNNPLVLIAQRICMDLYVG